MMVLYNAYMRSSVLSALLRFSPHDKSDKIREEEERGAEGHLNVLNYNVTLSTCTSANFLSLSKCFSELMGIAMAIVLTRDATLKKRETLLQCEQQ
jgi:hypothetical protein